ncbi:MAG: tRNA (guanosine(37)-N1)-methyltransferase TrmD [Hellea sp.]|jgi:tRNA (guanine37-N1)-methyltransferase|nr:tRNA (guanosine(37)-N1)-methyltransferase TrmD [Hellea sp.]
MIKPTRKANNSWKASVITLFPDVFPGVLGASIIGNAKKSDIWQLETVDIRDFSVNRHRTVDSPPSGGGPGMVLKPDVAAKAIDSVAMSNDRPIIYLTPRGKPLTQKKVRELANGKGVIILCGRFEGVDQRVIEARQMEEISIGDYILAGGELAAQVLIEACVRLLPGVLGRAQSAENESFENGLLEYPLYTKPRQFEGRDIPDILLSGDHKKIACWRNERSKEITKARRTDLWQEYINGDGHECD